MPNIDANNKLFLACISERIEIAFSKIVWYSYYSLIEWQKFLIATE